MGWYYKTVSGHQQIVSPLTSLASNVSSWFSSSHTDLAACPLVSPHRCSFFPVHIFFALPFFISTFLVRCHCFVT